MAERSLGQPFDSVSLRFTCKFVAVPRYDQEVLNVDSDSLPVCSPERCDRVEEQSEGVHSKVIELLISVTVFLFQIG